MGTSDFLFQGSSPASFTGTTSSDPNMPAWWQDAVKGIITQGAAVAGQPYQSYPGPRIADFTPMQNQSFQAGEDLQNKGTPYVNQGGALVAQAGNLFDQGDYNKFLAPYLSGADSENAAVARLGTRNLTENILPAVNNGFIANGMFGNASANGVQSRNDLFDERAVRDANESILNTQAGVENQAYGNAMNAYQQGQNRQLAAGTAMGGLGQISENMGLQNIGALSALGGQQQNQNQNNLTLGYQDFLNQVQYPQTQLNNFSSLVHGYQPPQGTTSYNTGGVPNTTTASQGYGVAGALSGLAQLGSMGGLGGMS